MPPLPHPTLHPSFCGMLISLSKQSILIKVCLTWPFWEAYWHNHIQIILSNIKSVFSSSEDCLSYETFLNLVLSLPPRLYDSFSSYFTHIWIDFLIKCIAFIVLKTITILKIHTLELIPKGEVILSPKTGIMKECYLIIYEHHLEIVKGIVLIAHPHVLRG